MNRLMERGLLPNRATRVAQDFRLPLRMQGGNWARSPAWGVRLSRPLRASVVVGLSGGIAVIGCQPYLRAAPPAVAAIVQAVIVAITVILVHARAFKPQSMGQRMSRRIIDSAASN